MTEQEEKLKTQYLVSGAIVGGVLGGASGAILGTMVGSVIINNMIERKKRTRGS